MTAHITEDTSLAAWKRRAEDGLAAVEMWKGEAAKATSAERERCAKIAEAAYGYDRAWHVYYRQAGAFIAARIRQPVQIN